MSDLNCVFLGTGPMFAETRVQIESQSLSENVTLVGYVDDTVRYFQRSKILVMPSRSEGLPTAMLEAMSCGCVPVVSDVGNITEAALHGKSAMVVEDYGDIETFVHYARKLLTDQVFCNDLAEEGAKMVLKRYSIEAQAAVYAEIVDQGLR